VDVDRPRSSFSQSARLASPPGDCAALRAASNRAPRAHIVVDDDLIEGQGTTGVFFAGLLAIARHRPWLAVVLLVAVVAAILALGTVPREALARLLEAL
jgi:hypothetical protein